jgi:hypothetical protein
MASSGMNRMMVFEILPDFYTSKKEASMLSQLLKDRSTVMRPRQGWLVGLVDAEMQGWKPHEMTAVRGAQSEDTQGHGLVDRKVVAEGVDSSSPYSAWNCEDTCATPSAAKAACGQGEVDQTVSKDYAMGYMNGGMKAVELTALEWAGKVIELRIDAAHKDLELGRLREANLELQELVHDREGRLAASWLHCCNQQLERDAEKEEQEEHWQALEEAAMVAETEAIAEADRRSQLAERAAAIAHAVKVAAEQKKSRRRKERNMRGRGKNRNKKAKHQPGSADSVAGAAQDGETEQKMEEACMGELEAGREVE